jgi:hypothetical protein
MDTETLRTLSDFGALGVLGLFIVVGGISLRMIVNFISDRVLPIVTNHLVHIEESYAQLAVVSEQQQQEMEAHNELTRSLIEQVRVQNDLLTNKIAPTRRKRVNG